MKRILQVFYVIFSAIILSAAIQNEFLPLGSPLLGFFSLTPLYLALRNSKSYLESGLLTGLQVLLVHLMSSFWLGFFKDFAIFTLGASALGTGVIGFVFGQYLHYFIGSSKEPKLSGRRLDISPPLIFAAIWTIYEWAKSTGFLAYPWGTLIMTTYRWPLLTQIVDITGTWGLSFLLSFSSALAGEGLHLLAARGQKAEKPLFASYQRQLAWCAALLLLTLLYGYWQYNREWTPTKHLHTVMVQQNIDPWIGGDSHSIRISEELTDIGLQDCLEATGGKPDLVVWSESVLSYSFPEANSYYTSSPSPRPLIPYIQEVGVPFVIGGAVTVDRFRELYSNAALYFNQEGKYSGYYAKMQLVPFAEVIPGAQYEWVRKLLDALVGFSSGWTPGTELTLFQVPLKSGGQATISLPICFEDAFPSVCRALYHAGSEIFVNITNDSWSLTKSAEYQHFAIASYRAIEYRTTMIRSTNSGYSVVVDPRGQVIADMPLFQEAALYTAVPIYQRRATIYSILGEWVPSQCISFIVLLLLLSEGKRRRMQRSQMPHQGDLS